VGDQLAQEDLLVRVQRVRDQVQHLGDFGFERAGLGGGGHRSSVLCSAVAAAGYACRARDFKRRVAMPGVPLYRHAMAGRHTPLRFRARLLRPAAPKDADWSFLVLPKAASAKLPARSMVSVDGLFDGQAFKTTL